MADGSSWRMSLVESRRHNRLKCAVASLHKRVVEVTEILEEEYADKLWKVRAWQMRSELGMSYSEIIRFMKDRHVVVGRDRLKSAIEEIAERIRKQWRSCEAEDQ